MHPIDPILYISQIQRLISCKASPHPKRHKQAARMNAKKLLIKEVHYYLSSFVVPVDQYCRRLILPAFFFPNGQTVTFKPHV